MDSNSLYSQAIVNTNVGFCVVAFDGTIRMSNNAFKEITKGVKVLGSQLNTIVKTENGELALMLESVRRDRHCSKEVQFICHDEPFYAQANASLLHENGEDMLGIFFTEVNTHKNIEVKLEERIAQEIEKNRQKDQMMYQQSKLATMGEMIGNIAHQWRQPLNIMALVLQDIYIKFKLKALDAELMEKNYDKANNLLQYMSETIDDFRSFFSNEMGSEPFYLLKALHTIQDLVGSRFSTNSTECRIIGSEEVRVIGTQNGFKQVVINLLNNAQEAIILNETPKGEILIDVKKENNFACVTVQDNGGGVPSDILEQIFEPYFTTKHQTQGTGLGLYMSKQIIEKSMNGRLEVENTKEGAKFSIWLPMEA